MLIVLQTGLTPSAAGSAYFELTQHPPATISLIPLLSTIKLTCTVHGPRSLPRSTTFTPNLVLSTHVKFAPFAVRQRRGYLRDSSERDLTVHLETALKGAIIGDRWPKSGLDVIVTILEGEEDQWLGDDARFESNRGGSSGLMSILSGCITVACAAIVDAGMDCVDLVSGGIAAIIQEPSHDKEVNSQDYRIVLDPVPLEHSCIIASCVVGYLQSRDELTEVWIKGGMPVASPANQIDSKSIMVSLVDSAVRAASASRLVLVAAIEESVDSKIPTSISEA